MTVKQKKKLFRILIAAVLLIVLYVCPLEGTLRLFIYLIPYLVVGWIFFGKRYVIFFTVKSLTKIF